MKNHDAVLLPEVVERDFAIVAAQPSAHDPSHWAIYLLPFPLKVALDAERLLRC